VNAAAQADLQTDDLDVPDGWFLLSDPDISEVETELVQAALGEPRLSAGRMVAHFEERVAAWIGRAHAVAVGSGTLGTWLVLRALGIGPGDTKRNILEVATQEFSSMGLAGARVVFSEIDYWSGCLDPVRAAAQVTPATKAIIAGNVNGHPAAWNALRALADAKRIHLIEDSTEALGSRYGGRLVGSFGDASVFDFSQPSALCCGEGGMVVTDDAALAAELRYLRSRSIADRRSVSVGSRVPLQSTMSEPTAALGAGQLARIESILARRKTVEGWYLEQMQTFEGIKPPYLAPDVDEVHWMLFVVHLGKRFTVSACEQIVEDLATELIESVLYCRPLHQEFHYMQQGWKRGDFPLVERIADRAIALPLHGHLERDHVTFIVRSLKSSSLNVGSGADIF
jgi:dTDP-4-amino-4,6-dideoxygalactose transaminase